MIERDVDNASEVPKPSKSQRKRDMADAYRLILRLLELPDQQLASLGLSAPAITALGTIRPIRPSAARQRQVKYVAKRLQREDVAVARLILTGREEMLGQVNERFHRLEHWRDRLVAEGDKALADAIAAFPGLDRQQLRQLIRSARRERDQHRPPSSARKLYKVLKQHSDDQDR